MGQETVARLSRTKKKLLTPSMTGGAARHPSWGMTDHPLSSLHFSFFSRHVIIVAGGLDASQKSFFTSQAGGQTGSKCVYLQDEESYRDSVPCDDWREGLWYFIRRLRRQNTSRKMI